MSMSAASICPLPDGTYRIASRNTDGTGNNFLAVLPNNTVGVTSNATEWFLAYIPNRGSYRIWQHTTNNVLDATRATGGNALVWAHHGADWQQWAIRLQTDLRIAGSNRVTGYTLTPLSQPQHVLTMGALDQGGPAVPARLVEAPRVGGEIPMRQLWVLSWLRSRPRTATTFSAEPAEEPAREGEPWEFGEEFDFESSYCEEVQAQIAQAKEREE